MILFSIPVQSTDDGARSDQSWPPPESFPLNRSGARVRDIVGADLRASVKPQLVAGYSSIAELVDMVAGWRRELGDKPGSVRILLGSEPFRSQRQHFASPEEEFTEEVREYWHQQSISVRLSARVIRVIQELDAGSLRVRVIPGPRTCTRRSTSETPQPRWGRATSPTTG